LDYHKRLWIITGEADSKLPRERLPLGYQRMLILDQKHLFCEVSYLTWRKMVEFLGLLPQEGLMVILNMVGFVVMRLKMKKYRKLSSQRCPSMDIAEG
jgi:hypothetical protein